MRITKSILLAAILAAPLALSAATATVLGWNNLGMHCMDSDYSVFSILPPYNTVEAQLIVGGRLVTNGAGYTVTYEAVADPDGSFNSTAMGKGNFYTFAQALYGANLAPETGLASWAMPGPGNTPQSMLFEPTNHPAAGVAAPVNWWRAEGIPLSPYDDAHRKNPYPLMLLVARDSTNSIIATNQVVLPVSDEMDCRACHASGTLALNNPAQPAAGWVWVSNPERDYRLNILRLHDERQFALHSGLYTAALAAGGYNPQGLYRGVVADGRPVLCAACHSSEALGTSSYSNIPPLTASVHAYHAHVKDPDLNITLDNLANRAACYRCHPGSTTRCLRGAMGSAIAADGSMEMQCQSCHGNMSTVGSSNRVGWFMEPNCQSCHTGTANNNNGQIRYTSAFETNGQPRVPVNLTFATTPNAPATGLSLYRFSTGHSGLQCSACHGSTHAEFPSSHTNDNLRNLQLPFQNHAGVVSECLACHATTPSTVDGGPHGLHPLGQTWVDRHPDAAEGGGSGQCQACHGTDSRGTVLSRAQADRTLTSKFGARQLWRGMLVGCYLCHNGPSNGDNATPYTAPTVANVSASTTGGASVGIVLSIANSTGNPPVVRVIHQPQHGSVRIDSNSHLTYLPDAGYVGGDTFLFAASNGYLDSNLATGAVTVAQGPFTLSAQAEVASTAPAGWPASFGVVATPSNLVATVQYLWDFGDGQTSSNQFATHGYAAPGTFSWKVTSSVSSGLTQASVTNAGAILITAPQTVTILPSGNQIQLTWLLTDGDALLEWTSALSPSPSWVVDTNQVILGPLGPSVTVNDALGTRFYRLKKL